MIRKEDLKQLKVIVFDLDGTLLNDNGEIGEETIGLVKELRGMGMRFSFASGRLHSAIQSYAEELEINGPIISLDGSYIETFPKKEVIFKSFVSDRYVRKAIKLADRFLLKVALCQAEAIYYTENNSTIVDLLEKFGAEYKEVSSYENYLNSTLEIVITGDFKDSIKYVENKMMFPYSFGLNTSYYKSHKHGGIYYLEIRKQGTSKGTGLKRIARHLGVKVKETAVIGDWYNDRSLFETSALKIAVANAVPEIQRLADFTTKRTNNEDATAEFLKMVFDAKRR
ncbi:MAG: HAD family hydrolase [Melioribacteraceae bacterium]|nr:HAD family hydrolase [Melioribacteraceae bacterium]MCF8353475.1 HAD family hydrolase [Melioribacteraceae bacterium]MCF8392604.1 HAD family hydrolase [Melioribacteraceae bacterium]MCF8418524.1 HAD family hydrolase [Melioribacteraceae bacterium]